MHIAKKEPTDYFGILTALGETALACLADGGRIEEADTQYRSFKNALIAEYVPPMERADLVRLGRSIYLSAQNAARCGRCVHSETGKRALGLLEKTASHSLFLMERLACFRRTERFAALIEQGDALHRETQKKLLAFCGELPATEYGALAGCADALWQVGETVEEILIKYA